MPSLYFIDISDTCMNQFSLSMILIFAYFAAHLSQHFEWNGGWVGVFYISDVHTEKKNITTSQPILHFHLVAALQLQDTKLQIKIKKGNSMNKCIYAAYGECAAKVSDDLNLLTFEVCSVQLWFINWVKHTHNHKWRKENTNKEWTNYYRLMLERGRGIFFVKIRIIVQSSDYCLCYWRCCV